MGKQHRQPFGTQSKGYNKTNMMKKSPKFIYIVENRTGLKVKRLRSDKSSEYVSDNFKEFYTVKEFN